tara:strand:- start:6888 stop:7151 length:264 start_codon:yes stop_codon:yes gene_type:complete
MSTGSSKNKQDPTDPTWFDIVVNPEHYTRDRTFEPLDVIEDWDLDYQMGNALKYISRAGRKGSLIADLQKAIFYLERRISLETERNF